MTKAPAEIQDSKSCSSPAFHLLCIFTQVPGDLHASSIPNASYPLAADLWPMDYGYSRMCLVGEK
jgi:hypothetical protein